VTGNIDEAWPKVVCVMTTDCQSAPQVLVPPLIILQTTHNRNRVLFAQIKIIKIKIILVQM